ncbi:MAG: ABC transporter ATP-binding protein [Candidatus Methylomirabilales bacterium]
MSQIAIRVENLSKQYKIGIRRHDRLKDLLTSGLTGLFCHSRSPVSGPSSSRSPVSGLPSSEYIWALKDVSFTVKQGETLGIIGPNGAGKSTLLKILSRITEPTAGRAEIYGRVGSLLEVGTGFDRELTGRENVYLNGAILGMRNAEIDRKFDEIVDFSGVEKFIDTPVKHYSSGMYVRLAFAVAAHLEPEILIVDEVLAVGDAQFQKKCLGKMGDVAKQGRTVLFVSHNMGAVRNLCSRALLLREGHIQLSGTTDDAIQEYLITTYSDNGAPYADLTERQDRFGSGNVRVVTFEARACADRFSPPRTGGDTEFIVGYSAREEQPLLHLYVGITVTDTQGVNLISFSTGMTNSNFRHSAPRGQVICRIKNLPLIPGVYWADVSIKDAQGQADYVSRAARITVIDGGDSGFTDLPKSKWGSVIAPHAWELIPHKNPAEDFSASGFNRADEDEDS